LTEWGRVGAGAVKGMMNPKIRISKHESRNKFEYRMTKVPNGRVLREAFMSLENSDLGIVSDFGFRISDLTIGLYQQNKTPCIRQSSYRERSNLAEGGQGRGMEK
jgi:hypothetical protein